MDRLMNDAQAVKAMAERITEPWGYQIESNPEFRDLQIGIARVFRELSKEIPLDTTIEVNRIQFWNRAYGIVSEYNMTYDPDQRPGHAYSIDSVRGIWGQNAPLERWVAVGKILPDIVRRWRVQAQQGAQMW